MCNFNLFARDSEVTLQSSSQAATYISLMLNTRQESCECQFFSLLVLLDEGIKPRGFRV